jgi:hypothetical protein
MFDFVEQSKNQIQAAFGKTAVQLLGNNPTITRLAGAGVNPGAANSNVRAGNPLVQFGGGFDKTGVSGNDWRVKVTLPAGSPIFAPAFSGVMYRLKNDKGVVFPFTPTVALSHTAKYESQSLVHSNYNFYSYTGSETGAINITGDFAVQNIEDAHYLLGSIYFFRACTKMFYGSGEYVGNPPPIVILSGYGRMILPKVPCIVTSFTHTLPGDVDYIVDTETTGINSDCNWLPAHSQLSVTLQPVVSRNKQSNFDLNSYAGGRQSDLGSLGGFL